MILKRIYFLLKKNKILINYEQKNNMPFFIKMNFLFFFYKF